MVSLLIQWRTPCLPRGAAIIYALEVVMPSIVLAFQMHAKSTYADQCYSVLSHCHHVHCRVCVCCVSFGINCAKAIGIWHGLWQPC